MTVDELRERFVRHSVETESLFVVDHWRIWARGRDSSGDLREVTYDAAPGEACAPAIATAIDMLVHTMFPAENDPAVSA